MKKRVMAMLMCIFMTVSFLPSAAFAAENQTQTAAQLSANAVKAIAEKTAAAENFNKEMEIFRGNMEANLKTTGNSKLDGLKNNMDLIQESWEKVSAEAGSDYTYDMSTNTLTVSTAAGLAWMAQQVNSGSLAGTAVTLAADIDLTGKLWTPAKDFTGTFDGQNHTIKGLAINNEAFEDKLVYLGLFQNIKGNKDVHSFVKNVTFENISVYAPMFTVDLSKNLPGFGAAAGYSDYTDYENITVTGEVVLYAMGGAAGIVYDSAYDSSRGSSIKNCAVKDAAVYASEDFYGMTYNACNAPVIQNCTVSGSFYVKDEFAGIAYYACYGALIKDCSVSGSIYSDNDFYGITYEIESNEYEDGDGNGQNIISGCSVDVNVCSGDDLFGLAYSVEDDSIISECNISGTFYSSYYFFGLAEALKDGGTVEKCTISGKAYGYKGGAAGFEYVYGSDDDENERKPASIFNIEANLTASYPEGQAGGLIIETDGNVNISDCTVAGEIYSFSDDAFGGIVSEKRQMLSRHIVKINKE